MLIYRRQAMHDSPGARIRDLIGTVDRWPRLVTHEEATTVLIELGELESGVEDARQPVRDELSEESDAWSDAMLAAADVLWVARRARNRIPPDSDGDSDAIRALLGALDRLQAQRLPSQIERSVCEGFAYYGLSPDAYDDAARRLPWNPAVDTAHVIGIRSIGTTLSAVVAAALRRRGVRVTRVTVRPRGHPFDRRLDCGPRLLDRWRGASGQPHVIVDEGPGLSGSSFIAVARALMQAAIAPADIVLMPSWMPDVSQLRSPAAREWWPRLRQIPAAWSFEPHLDGLALAGALLAGEPLTVVADLGAGRWRERTISGADSGHPPVHPQHERLKFLARRSGRVHAQARAHGALAGDGDGDVLIKWAGLGRYGAADARRAEALAAAGWSLPRLAEVDGFSLTPWVAAQPLRTADVDTHVVERLARYASWRRGEARFPAHVDPAPLIELIEVNVSEALGGEAAAGLDLEALAAASRAQPAVHLDARLFPHEWIRLPDAAGVALTTDGVEHGDGHFLPGPTDIAWDLAGACVEFDLDAHHARHLVDTYRRLTGDATIAARLPFFTLAYLAFRTGYTSIALDTLRRTPEGPRFAAAHVRYLALLRRALREATAQGARRYTA